MEALTGPWTFNFIGNAGADAFFTGNANDIFTGRAGNDTFYGNFGYDRAYYGSNAGHVEIGLAAGVVLEFSSGPTPVLIGTDTLRSIELVTGSNDIDSFDATGFGTSGPNLGSEVTSNADGLFNEFEGRGGDDLIIGNGQTRISYYHATAGVTVTFAPNSWTVPRSGASGAADRRCVGRQRRFFGRQQRSRQLLRRYLHGRHQPVRDRRKLRRPRRRRLHRWRRRLRSGGVFPGRSRACLQHGARHRPARIGQFEHRRYAAVHRVRSGVRSLPIPTLPPGLRAAVPSHRAPTAAIPLPAAPAATSTNSKAAAATIRLRATATPAWHTTMRLAAWW